MPHGFNLGPDLTPGGGNAGGAPPTPQFNPTPPAPPAEESSTTIPSDSSSWVDNITAWGPEGFTIIATGFVGGGYLLFRYGGPLLWWGAKKFINTRFASKVAFGWPGLLFPFKGTGHGDGEGKTGLDTLGFNDGLIGAGTGNIINTLYGTGIGQKRRVIKVHDISQANLDKTLAVLQSLTVLDQYQQTLLAKLVKEQAARDARFRLVMSAADGILKGVGRLFPMWLADP